MPHPVTPDPTQTLYLIDISSFIFRAFFAIRSLRNQAGEPTNAVYGVATMLAKLADEATPEYLAVVYDSKEPSFRKTLYPEYKANRSAPPEDLIPQFARIEEMIRSFEMHSYRQSGFEADDLIATLTQRWCEVSPHHQVVIVSGDKDLMQLVTERVKVWDTLVNKSYGPAEVEEKFGVRPDQIRDYLALIGDSSDNIPGVPSIGPKGACELLKKFGSLPAILTAAEEGKIPGKKGEVLKLHRADAILSADLATVRRDLEVQIPMESLKYHFHVTDACVTLFQELNFHTLLAKWKSASAGTQESSPEGKQKWVEPDPRFRKVNTENAFQALLKSIQQTMTFGFDLETTSLNPREAQIVGIAICTDPEFGCYIPLAHQLSLEDASEVQLSSIHVLQALKPFLENPQYKKIGQNLKYDWSVLREHGIIPSGIEADTMVAAYLLDPDGRHNLKTLASQYLNYPMLTYEDVCGKGKNQVGFDQVRIDAAVRYSAEDAWIAVKLWNELQPRLEAEGVLPVFTHVDLPLVDVLTKMELQGVCIDVDWLKTLSQEFKLELDKIETQVQAYSPNPINLNSTRQLAQLLFEELKLPTQSKTKTGFSTDASVLETLSPLHEVPRLLLEYREISKLKGTYVDPLPLLRDPRTGKIHASFHQTVAATGRLSSSNPNLQNIPVRTDRGMKIRRAFIPSPGNVLLSADYSQIELRLLAHMSQDPELMRSFLEGEDVHRRTASELFEISPEKVDERQRGIAKAINFGLMYGKTVFGLSQELRIPRREAQEIIERYFTRYRGVKSFLDGLILDAKDKGFAVSLMGRKRRLPDLLSKNAMIRGNAERMAMNTPIQGTAADLMKLAMIAIDRELEKGGFRSKLTIQVHDEVVLDCPRDEVEEVKQRVVDEMENAMRLSVPLKVNTAVGKNWMDL